MRAVFLRHHPLRANRRDSPLLNCNSRKSCPCAERRINAVELIISGKTFILSYRSSYEAEAECFITERQRKLLHIAERTRSNASSVKARSFL